MPDISADQNDAWTLAIDGEVEQSRTWDLSGLKRDFETVSIEAVLECAGNGRVGFVPRTPGLQWRNGAVGCALWRGVRLRDVLIASRVRDSAVYTSHYSPDVQIGSSDKPSLSRGLPIAKAMAPETLLAFEMNDEPLPFLHGGPLRVVAPGFPGSAWQKWITRIWVRDCVHDGEKMGGTHYRLPRQISPGAPIDTSEFDIITQMPVKSLITFPEENFSLRCGDRLSVRGFAWSGRAPISSVLVSADHGGTWHRAELERCIDQFAWRRFSFTIEARVAGPVVLVARASDQAGNTQPLDSAPWNPGGYCNNQVHRVSGLIE